ncbi:zinc transporter [Natrialba chahannaoensis JCM 10990]|uniref:Zinc transporter n=2 Tax=Natrialba chahannaoensis TaxID=68911 RepID=M0AFT4_9EURY|nr:zinc transporter [Natrialba chahannaoensis JCM 10990]
MASASTSEVMWMMTIIGLLAGVMPVAIGMLWFPFIKSLDNIWVHAALALSAGILAFIGIEMVEEMFENGEAIAESGAGTVELAIATAVGVVGIAGTFYLMKTFSQWRLDAAMGETNPGLKVAYMIAIGLGLHSIGEGLAIGTSFATGAYSAVTILVVGFVLHNITEGLSIVAALARDADRPPLYHFVAVGFLAGGPLVFGSWLGIFAFTPVVAILFLAIGVGAIIEVIWEVTELVRIDTGAAISKINAATFVGGVVLMFLLEEVLVEGYILG